MTIGICLKERPDLILVVNPPIFAVLVAWFYCSLSRKCFFITDTHSAAFTAKRWARFLWLYRIASKYAAINILHNRFLEEYVASWGRPTYNLGEIPYFMDTDKTYCFCKDFNVVFVSIFSEDEPLLEVIAAAMELPDIDFFVTGSLSRAPMSHVKSAPNNLLFTDFLPDEEYKALLKGCDIVISLTKNDFTMQNGAYEALALGRPIITSDWPVLKNIYSKGAICINNTSKNLVDAILEIKYNYSRYLNEMSELREDINLIWKRKISELLAIIEHRHL